ncbi:MAG: hypothetical protein A2Y95_06330 [Deltaproteobacteria bacterium RBG_13_65_10]|nr:MAG: hypothetical protein A2Y95_06330 [Deltaproteobacteria bacterium RBG_13_65_10]
MAFQGTLGDFSIAEIFQLIGQQQKTGVLSVTREGEVVHVIFDQGRVMAAAEGDHGEDDRLVERLERMGLLSSEKIREMRDSQKGSTIRIGPILEAKGVLTKEEMTILLSAEIYDIVLKLFLWEHGCYEFTPRRVRFDPDIGPGVPSEQILLDGLRMKDEWNSVSRSVPDWNALAVRTDISAPAEGKNALGSLDRRIYELSDGTRTIRAIIDHSRLVEFEACRILANLRAQGYINILVQSRPRGEPQRWSDRYPPAALAACLAAVVGCALLAGALLGPLMVKAGPGAGLLLQGLEPRIVLEENRRTRIREALEVYRLAHGYYPARLDALAGEGLVGRRDVRIPVQYKVRDGAYTLLASGH